MNIFYELWEGADKEKLEEAKKKFLDFFLGSPIIERTLGENPITSSNRYEITFVKPGSLSGEATGEIRFKSGLPMQIYEAVSTSNIDISFYLAMHEIIFARLIYAEKERLTTEYGYISYEYKWLKERSELPAHLLYLGSSVYGDSLQTNEDIDLQLLYESKYLEEKVFVLEQGFFKNLYKKGGMTTHEFNFMDTATQTQKFYKIQDIEKEINKKMSRYPALNK